MHMEAPRDPETEDVFVATSSGDGDSSLTVMKY